MKETELVYMVVDVEAGNVYMRVKKPGIEEPFSYTLQLSHLPKTMMQGVETIVNTLIPDGLFKITRGDVTITEIVDDKEGVPPAITFEVNTSPEDEMPI